MAYIPLAVGVSAVAAEMLGRVKLPLRLALAGLLALPCLACLPVQLASTWYFWHDRDYARVETLVEKNVGPTIGFNASRSRTTR